MPYNKNSLIVFKQFIINNPALAFSSHPDTEKSVNLLTSYLEYQTKTPNNKIDLKTYLCRLPLTAEQEAMKLYKNILALLKIMMPSLELNLKTASEVLAFFYLCFPVEDILSIFLSCPSEFQILLLTDIPKPEQNEIPGLLQYVIENATIDQIDQIITRIAEFTHQDQCQIISHLESTLDDKERKPSPCEALWRHTLISYLKRLVLQRNQHLSFQKKQEIYFVLWQAMSEFTKKKPVYQFILPYIFNFLSIEKKLQLISENHIPIKCAINMTLAQQHLLSVLQGDSKAVNESIILFVQKEKGTLSEDDFNTKILSLIENTPFLLLDWLISEDQLKNKNGQHKEEGLQKILDHFFLFFKNKDSIKKLMPILKVTNYLSFPIVYQKLITEIENINLPCLYSLHESLKSEQREIPVEQMSLFTHAVILAKNKIIERYKENIPKNIDEFIVIIENCPTDYFKKLAIDNIKYDFSSFISEDSDILKILDLFRSHHKVTNDIKIYFLTKILFFNKDKGLMRNIPTLLTIYAHINSNHDMVPLIDSVINSNLNWIITIDEEKEIMETKIKLFFLLMALKSYESKNYIQLFSTKKIDELVKNTAISRLAIKKISIYNNLFIYFITKHWETNHKEVIKTLYASAFTSDVVKAIHHKIINNKINELPVDLFFKILPFYQKDDLKKEIIDYFINQPVIRISTSNELNKIMECLQSLSVENTILTISKIDMAFLQLIYAIDGVEKILMDFKRKISEKNIEYFYFFLINFESMIIRQLIPHKLSYLVRTLNDFLKLISIFSNESSQKIIFSSISFMVKKFPLEAINILAACNPYNALMLMNKLKQKKVIIDFSLNIHFNILLNLDAEVFYSITSYLSMENINWLIFNSKPEKTLSLFSAKQQQAFFSQLHRMVLDRKANPAIYNQSVAAQFEKLMKSQHFLLSVKQEAIPDLIVLMKELNCFSNFNYDMLFGILNNAYEVYFSHGILDISEELASNICSLPQKVTLFLENIRNLFQKLKLSVENFRQLFFTINELSPSFIYELIDLIGKSRIDQFFSENPVVIVSAYAMLQPLEINLVTFFKNISDQNLEILWQHYLSLTTLLLDPQKIKAFFTLKKLTLQNVLSTDFSEVQLENWLKFLLDFDNLQDIIISVEDINAILNKLPDQNKNSFLSFVNNHQQLAVLSKRDDIILNCKPTPINSYSNDVSRINNIIDHFFDDLEISENAFFDTFDTLKANPLPAKSESDLILDLANEFNAYSENPSTFYQLKKNYTAPGFVFAQTTLVIEQRLKNIAKVIADWIRNPNISTEKMSDYYTFIQTTTCSLEHLFDPCFRELVFKAKTLAEQFPIENKIACLEFRL